MTADRPAITLDLPDPAATEAVARWLADHLGPGDVLLLQGPIGAGKTHLARTLIQHRLAADGTMEDVPSPTFTLVQVYDTQGGEIWHADLYRLSHPQDVLELGLDEAFDTALCLIEWPDRLGSLTPPQALTLTLTPRGEGRRATLTGPSARLSALGAPPPT
ncbi:tRNA threonylcarbamoyladenosine biosynthesis protein TsaE [Gemmobacter megaterium]|uniref:tRNA threonylcarbamoyladenosine biosynthesis protein TsaE n=1 Tax=Gemmobacter megaterium TaxID=1086013 RepID=A0A1N7MIJ1_9RHOB|nr:tRNA (adenosine(37)-N6)-threonylcarbamoyltransferase complex ATPase subunit type 1 TsaE [Gemmobacter megaterium]GGE06651.1 tRNA (adenosine(37)-N6)-threonylcarbamoyltransferase complex ATPase subunit type 1 TsaE [Gemmobacter megaterium]SIS85771.1 tRNA threonylcarbamoyladenosine biosynthesis protein TsaE [Gemmobacter megaterium]